jgi:hypothetical protein
MPATQTMASPSNRHRQHIRIPGRFHTTTGISIPPAGAESGPAWRSLLEARLRRLLREATAARRALSNTEEALAGLVWTGQSSKENHITRDRDGLGSGTGG